MNFSELSHKMRSTNDLIRFVGNRESDKQTAHFSILLGSGSSVTSGIKSGGELIRQWKEEIFTEDNPMEAKSAEEYFSNFAPHWFDASNPYSCLFEKRYDLQSQRRAFVEREVAEKSPSLGYAYLVRLIENGYFNTVFTTNFDDLLNEAFYRYSNERPIVCAHDSSISGVTVTSKRPKIIKLHGDYLFENIKATIRETESLEENMKLKFQEFAKDFGLIVIGYSGCDRSIMDTLSSLLHREEYFKNGIYWCVRSSDLNNISFELKKLLWKDRVYVVEIDGFDELMAEMHYKLLHNYSPINNERMSLDYQRRIIKELTDKEYTKLSKSKYIKQGCDVLQKQLADSRLSDIVDFLKERRNMNEDSRLKKEHNTLRRKNKLRKLSPEELEIIQNITFNRVWSNNSVNLPIPINEVMKLEDSVYKSELLELYVENNRELTDEEVKLYYDELIRLLPESQRQYVMASNASTSYPQKKSYLEQACAKFPNDYYVYNMLADCILDYLMERLDLRIYNSDFKQLNDAIENSLRLNANLDNQAHLFKIQSCKMEYSNDVPKRTEIYSCVIDKYKKANQDKSFNFLKIVEAANSEEFSEKNIKSTIEFLKQADNPQEVERCYILLINKMKENDTHKIEDVLAICNEYEDLYEPSTYYNRQKANLLYSFGMVSECKSILDRLPESERVHYIYMNLIFNEKGTDALTEYYGKINNKTPYITQEYYSLMGMYDEICKSMSHVDKQDFTEQQLVDYSFALLKSTYMDKYQQVANLLKPYYDNPTLTNGVIKINYLFAAYHNDTVKLKAKVDEKILKEKKGEDDQVLLAANILKGEHRQASSLLKKILKKDKAFKFSFVTWAIVEDLLEKGEYKDVLSNCQFS